MELRIGDKVEISMSGVVSGMSVDLFSKQVLIIVEGYEGDTYLRASVTQKQIVGKEEVA
jgi:hypothetical protein